MIQAPTTPVTTADPYDNFNRERTPENATRSYSQNIASTATKFDHRNNRAAGYRSFTRPPLTVDQYIRETEEEDLIDRRRWLSILPEGHADIRHKNKSFKARAAAWQVRWNHLGTEALGNIAVRPRDEMYIRAIGEIGYQERISRWLNEQIQADIGNNLQRRTYTGEQVFLDTLDRHYMFTNGGRWVESCHDEFRYRNKTYRQRVGVFQGFHHTEIWSIDVGNRSALYIPVPDTMQALEVSELYCVPDPPVTLYSATAYHRHPKRELKDDILKQNIINMAEAEMVLLSWYSALHTAKYGARYHRMPDPRISGMDRRRMIIAYMPPAMCQRLFDDITFTVMAEGDANMVRQAILWNRLRVIDWEAIAREADVSVRSVYLY